MRTRDNARVLSARLPPVPPYRSLSIQRSDKTTGSAKHFNLHSKEIYLVGKEKEKKGEIRD